MFSKIKPFLFYIVTIVLAIFICVFGIIHDITHCYELTIVYTDATVETIHCDNIHERNRYILIDFDRKIILSSVREYSYIVVDCNCTK